MKPSSLPAAVVTLDAEPFAAAIQIAAVLAYPNPKDAQRAVGILQMWQKVRGRSEGRHKPLGMSPARVQERLIKPSEFLRRRFEAAEWALMLASAQKTSIKVRFGAAPPPTVRALARWSEDKPLIGAPNVIRSVWTATKPVLSMACAVRGQFDHTPDLEDLCFHSDWVAPAVQTAEFMAWWLSEVPGVEYRAQDRVEFHMPNLISGTPEQST